MTTLVWIKLAAALALVALIGGSYWYTYEKGDTNGAARKQAEWDAATAKAEAQNKEFREEGYELAAEYESKLHALEKRYARTDAQLRAALNEPVQCPASGRVGDVYLPASLIDSMFNREGPGSAAPGPAAGKPDAVVR
jgi:uncharacterized protein HemX